MKKIPAEIRWNKQGFTLVEILVSLAIFTFGGFALVSVLMQSMQTTHRSARTTEAAALASQKIESFRNMPLGKILVSENVRSPDTLATFPPEAALGWDGEEEYQGIETGQSYKIYWNAVPDFPVKGITSLCMEIQWEERNEIRSMRFNFTKNQLF